MTAFELAIGFAERHPVWTTLWVFILTLPFHSHPFQLVAWNSDDDGADAK